MIDTLTASVVLYDQLSSPLQRMSAALMSTINTMQDLHKSVKKDFDTSGFDYAREQIAMASAELQEMASNTARVTAEQEQLNAALQNGSSFADGLSGKIMGMVGAYASIQGLGKLAGLSDTMSSNAARLELILDDGGSVDELEAKIFESAQRSRASFLDVTNSVAKLGLTAKHNFSGMDEIVAFTELLNKNFVIGGTGAQEQAAAMYQLNQAMASGRLQGDEYRSIIENAPLLAKSIEDYMRNVQGAEGSMKDWASQGLLTADVIRAAVFNSAEQIEERFERMPMTWGQIWTGMANSFISMSEPILNTLSWMAEHWSILAPLVGAVAFLMAGYVATLGVYKGLTMAAAVAESLRAAALAKQSGATFTAIAAQHGLNAALMASPVTWILVAIIGIVAALYAVVAVINKVTGSSVSATGIILGAINFAIAVIWNGFLGLFDLILGQINALVNPMINFANFFANIFHSPISSVIYAFQALGDSSLAVLEKIASAMDFVFGSNMAGTIAEWRAGLRQMADEAVAQYAPNENYQKVMDTLDLSVESLGLKRYEYGKAWEYGYKKGEEIENWIGGIKGDTASVLDGLDGLMGGIDETAYNTSEMKNALDVSNEELKFLKDLAERDVVNRFTTAEIKFDMTNTNHIGSNVDADSILAEMSNKLKENMIIAAEGVSR